MRIFQTVICHIINILPSVALFLPFRRTQVTMKHLFTLSHSKVEHRFSAERPEIIAPIPHPPGRVVHVLHWERLRACVSLRTLGTSAISLNRLRITVSLCHTSGVPMDTLCVCVCVFLCMSHSKYQNLHFTRKVRTFLVSGSFLSGPHSCRGLLRVKRLELG